MTESKKESRTMTDVIELIKKRDNVSTTEAIQIWDDTVQEAKSITENGGDIMEQFSELEDLLMGDGFDLDEMFDLIEAMA